MMLDGALVDTSFLISLVKPAEANHGAAKSYYKGCLERQIPLYLSTIVISEFTVKQAVIDPGRRNYFVLPFNSITRSRRVSLGRRSSAIRPMQGRS